MFSLPISNSFSSLMYQFRIDHNSSPSTNFFTLDIPHGDFTACYDVNTKYLRITQDETMAVEISPQQFRICQEANGQFCTIPMLFQPLANSLSCITALYVKNIVSIQPDVSYKAGNLQMLVCPHNLPPMFGY